MAWLLCSQRYHTVAHQRLSTGLELSGEPPHHRRRSFREGTFPNAQNRPASCAQRAVHQPISRPIACNLLSPEIEVVLGLAKGLGITVPKIAVHKNCETRLRKHKVGFTHDASPPSPAGNSSSSHQEDKPQLGRLIAARSDAGHQRRAALAAQHVSHCVILVDAALEPVARFNRQATRRAVQVPIASQNRRLARVLPSAW